MSKAVPLRDFIIVTKEDQAQKTASGLIMVGVGNHITGTVIAVGSGKLSLDGTSIPLEVKVGDKVLFNKNTAVEVKVDSQDVYCLREEQLLCIVG